MQAQFEVLAFSRRKAADALGISLRTLDYLLAQGKLRGRHIGRRIVIPRVEIERFLRRDTPIVQASASSAQTAEQ